MVLKSVESPLASLTIFRRFLTACLLSKTQYTYSARRNFVKINAGAWQVRRAAYRFSASDTFRTYVLNKHFQNAINKICGAAEDFIERSEFTSSGALDRHRRVGYGNRQWKGRERKVCWRGWWRNDGGCTVSKIIRTLSGSLEDPAETIIRGAGGPAGGAAQTKREGDIYIH